MHVLFNVTSVFAKYEHMPRAEYSTEKYKHTPRDA